MLWPLVALKIVLPNFKMSLLEMTPDTLTSLSCSRVVLEKSIYWAELSVWFLELKIYLALKRRYL